MSPREVGSIKSRADSGSLYRVGYLCLNISTDVFPITCLLCISPLTQIQNERRKECSSNSDMLLVNVCMLCLVTPLCPALCDPMDYSPPGSSVHGDSPGKNTGVGCHFFLQGIFPTRGLNLCLLHWQADSLSLEHQGSPSKEHFSAAF